MFKTNPEFSILSLNVDKEKSRWQKSLEIGKYSSLEYLNAYTGGQGLEHPFTHYYNIEALPFALLIDKQGKVYSPVRIDMNADEIKKLISEALLEEVKL